MTKKQINKLSIKGENIFVCQIIDNSGKEILIERKIDEIVEPIIKPYKNEIELLKNTLRDKIKINGYAEKEVLKLSSEISRLSKEKSELETNVQLLIKYLTDTSLNKSTVTYKMAVSSFIEGNIHEALNILDSKILDEEEKTIRDNINQLAEARLLRANLLYIENEIDEAEKNYIRSIELNPNWNNTIYFARFYWNIKNPEESEKYFKLSRKYGETIVQKAVSLIELGKLYLEADLIKKAEEINLESLELYKEIIKELSGSFNEEVFYYGIEFMFNTAKIYERNNNTKKTKKLYDILLPLSKKFSERGDRFLFKYAEVLNNHGIFNCTINEYGIGFQSFKKSLDIKKKKAQDGNIVTNQDVIRSQINIALYFESQNNLKEASNYAQEALDGCRELIKNDGRKHLDLLETVLKNYSIISDRSGEYDKAIKFAKESVSICRQLVEEYPNQYLKDLGGSLNNLSNSFRMLNKVKEAEECISESIELFRVLVEINPDLHSAELALTLGNMGNIKRDLRQFEETEELLKESLNIYNQLAEKNKDKYIIEVARTKINMGIFYKEYNNDIESAVHSVVDGIQDIYELDHLPRVKEYTGRAFNLIRSWNVDVLSYVKGKGIVPIH